jgi:hypothetical protein
MVAAPEALNRTQRRELARRLRVEDPGLDVHPHDAGSDVGDNAPYVAVRRDRDAHSVAGLTVSLRTCTSGGLVTTAWCNHRGDAVDRVYWIHWYESYRGAGV